MTANEKKQLMATACKVRMGVIEGTHAAKAGHPGGSLSAADLFTYLYFKEMNVDPKDPQMADRDRLVLCKGHAAPMLYRVLAEKGFFPVEEMATLRCFETRLQGHPCPLETPGVDAATGPLGIGLSAALGMSMALKLNNSPARVYAILGDGEINEGTVWEALMAAVKYKADNLCAVLDWNGVQLDGTADQIMPMGDIRAKFEAFGWHCIECDGHDVDALYDAFEQAKTIKGLPTIVLAHTIKGKGVSFMEGKNTWHGAPVKDADYEAAMKELGGVQ